MLILIADLQISKSPLGPAKQSGVGSWVVGRVQRWL